MNYSNECKKEVILNWFFKKLPIRKPVLFSTKYKAAFPPIWKEDAPKF